MFAAAAARMLRPNSGGLNREAQFMPARGIIPPRETEMDRGPDLRQPSPIRRFRHVPGRSTWWVAGSCGDISWDADAAPNGNACPHHDADAHADQHLYPISHAHPNSNPHANAYADAHAHAHPHAHAYPDADLDIDADPDLHTNPNTYGHPHSNQHSHADARYRGYAVRRWGYQHMRQRF